MSNNKLSYSKNSDVVAIKTINLNGCVVNYGNNLPNFVNKELVSQNASHKRLIELHDKTEKRIYYFIVENEEEREDWVLHINFANGSICVIQKK